MSRGFREGGPASPAKFNMYHANSSHHVRTSLTSTIPEVGVTLGQLSNPIITPHGKGIKPEQQTLTAEHDPTGRSQDIFQLVQ
eukprot:7366659-Pyramimonas_sp.AAC.1